MNSSWTLRHVFTAHSEVSAHALARGPFACRLKLRFRPEGGSLSCQQRQESNQRSAAPESAPSHRKRRSAMRGSPALLARGGFHPQAIHGLWVKSSASCLAPRLRAGLVAAGCDARRSQTGVSTAKQHQRHGLRYAQPILRDGFHDNESFVSSSSQRRSKSESC